MEHAFTDEMVRRDRDLLTSKALEYLNGYTGSFEPLLQARAFVRDGLPLPVAHIRLVLNAMRADTRIHFDYQPPAGTVIAFPRRPGVRFDDPFGGFVEDAPKKIEPRWRVHRRWSLKLPYGMSLQARAEVIHLMSQERSEVHYHPIGSWFKGEKVFNNPEWDFRLHYECSLAAKRLRMLTEDEAQVLVSNKLMRFCRTCQTFREQRGS